MRAIKVPQNDICGMTLNPKNMCQRMSNFPNSSPKEDCVINLDKAPDCWCYVEGF